MQTRVTTANTTVGTAVPEGAPSLPPRLSWGAIFAGGIVAVAVGTMLNVLGLAIGANVVDATAGQTPSGTTFGVTAGIWLLAANLIGLAVGGYVAARLSGTADGTDGVLHGLAVWGVGFLLSAVLLGNVVAGATSTAVQGASSMLGGLAQGVTSGAGQAANAAAPMLQGINPQQLIERAQTSLRTGGDPAAMTSDQRNAEIARLLTRRVTDGNLPAPDRDRLGTLVAAEYNIAPQEAQRRLTEVENQATQAAQTAERQARQAADAAATASAVAAYWIFAAMLLGAVAAVLGARIGTRKSVVVRQYA